MDCLSCLPVGYTYEYENEKVHEKVASVRIKEILWLLFLVCLCVLALG